VSSPSASAAPSKGKLLRVLGVGFGIAVAFGSSIGAGIMRTPATIAAGLPSACPTRAVSTMPEQGQTVIILGPSDRSALGKLKSISTCTAFARYWKHPGSLLRLVHVGRFYV
jgi:hypothetical protein